MLALPRGGVPVAFEAASAHPGAPLDVFVARKLGVPGDEELAMGAVANGGVRVLAVPTASPETCEQMRAEVDDIICAITPEPFEAVGRWYRNFSQTTDEEVSDLLAEALDHPGRATTSSNSDVASKSVALRRQWRHPCRCVV